MSLCVDSRSADCIMDFKFMLSTLGLSALLSATQILCVDVLPCPEPKLNEICTVECVFNCTSTSAIPVQLKEGDHIKGGIKAQCVEHKTKRVYFNLTTSSDNDGNISCSANNKPSQAKRLNVYGFLKPVNISQLYDSSGTQIEVQRKHSTDFAYNVPMAGKYTLKLQFYVYPKQAANLTIKNYDSSKCTDHISQYKTRPPYVRITIQCQIEIKETTSKSVELRIYNHIVFQTEVLLEYKPKDSSCAFAIYPDIPWMIIVLIAVLIQVVKMLN